ncbi:MAG: hypothetical protein JO186_09150 [Actinobacteria bacterium]|nr:hypothetical protein [Actinomycetota bacterium]MBV8396903.1 hypothetical protein [Actinomycetota bacterium]MBV8599685.1 hypothetical protein [Actinomycetota bacterium]
MSETPPEFPAGEPGDSAAPIGEPATGPLPLVPQMGFGDQPRYTTRFTIVYGALAGILLAAVGAFVILVVKPGHRSPAPWSAWKPAVGSLSTMASEIANHVSHEYKLNSSGAQLVAVVPSKPTVTSGTTNISIKAIAIRKTPNYEILNSNKSEMYTFCGLGDHCSIASGTPSSERGRLVRREALEVALYTFKFIPSVDSVIAFMPPAPGSTSSSLLFLQKKNYKDELSHPLKSTLRLAAPPLPTQPDDVEANTIDSLTLSSIFSYQLTALQTGGAALVLNPAT